MMLSNGNSNITQFPTKKNISNGTMVALYKNGYAIPARTSDIIIGVAVGMDIVNNTVKVMDAGVVTTSPAHVTSGSTSHTWTGTDEELKRKKQILKCDECGKKIGEYYGEYPVSSPFGETNTLCKTCHQVDKLTE